MGTVPEPYRYPVRRGAEVVGWVTLQEPLEGSEWNGGTFHPGPGSEPLRPLLEAALALSRQYKDSPDPAVNEAEDEALFRRWEAASDAVAALGLGVGEPPRPIGALRLFWDWGIHLYPIGERF